MLFLYFLFFINVLSQQNSKVTGLCGETKEQCWFEYDIISEKLIITGNGEFNLGIQERMIWNMFIDGFVRKIEIKGLTTIPSGLFRNGDQIEEMYISDVSLIQTTPFGELPNLEFLVLSGNIQEIQDNAFGSINNLKTVTFKGINQPLTCSPTSFDNFIEYALVDNNYPSEDFCGIPIYRLDSNGNGKGICGESETACSWIFTMETGVLEIQGNGNMDFSNSNTQFEAPWKPFIAYIEKVKMNGVQTTASYAFDHYYYLKEVSMEGIKKIVANSFVNCRNLFKITIGEGIDEIEELSFDGCPELLALSFTGITPPTTCSQSSITYDIQYIVVENNYNGNDFCGHALLRYDEDNSIHHSCGKTEEECLWKYQRETNTLSITGNGNMTFIDGGAWTFLRHEILELTIEGLIKIQENAFAHFDKIKEVILPDSLLEIGTSAFEGCTSLQKVVIGKKIKNIGYYTFSMCPVLFDIKYTGFKQPICEESFDYFEGSLSYVKVSNDYSDSLFCGLTVAREMENGQLSIGGSCGNTIEECKWSYNEQNQALTISGNGKMTNFIGDGNAQPWSSIMAFSVKTISISGIKSIGAFAFSSILNLQEIVIPESVESIYPYAFYACYFLKKVTIPTTIKEIHQYAFTYNLFLNTLIYEGKQEPEHCALQAFFYTPYLLKLTLTPNYEGTSFCGKPIVEQGEKIPIEGLCGKTKEECYWKFDIRTKTLTIDGNGDMKDFGEKNNHASWSHLHSLISILTINNLKSIGNNAFKFITFTEDFSIPETITKIGDYAFMGSSFNYGSTVVHISKNVNYIGKNPFAMTDAQITVDTENKFFVYDADSLFTSNKKRLIYHTPSEINYEYTIPEGVISIDSYSFSNERISVIELPQSLTTINDYAFFKTSNLNSITIPANVEYIGQLAMAQSAVKTIIYQGIQEPLYSSVITLHLEALISHVSVPRNYQGHKFCGLAIIKNQDVASKIKDGKCGLTEDDCYYAYNVETKKLIIDGNGAMFEYNKNDTERPWHWYFEDAKTIEIKSHLQTIGDFAFYGMKKVESIIMKESINEIGSEAFGRCDSLKSINYEGKEEPQCTNDVFRGTNIKEVETSGTYKLDEVCGIIENDSQIPPKEESSEKPKEESSEKPKEESSEKPKEESSEKPKEPSEQPKDESSEKPKEPSEQPKDESSEKPPEQKDPEVKQDDTALIAVSVTLSLVIVILLIVIGVLVVLFILKGKRSSQSNYEELREGVLN